MEALNGKASCVSKQYYHDSFIRLFRPSYPPPPAMSPLINRGYFTRVRALELIVQAFQAEVLAAAATAAAAAAAAAPSSSSTSSSASKAASPSSPSPSPRVNLVLLGAGLDTFFLRLREQEEKQQQQQQQQQEQQQRPDATAAAAAAEGLGKSITRCYYEVDFAPVVQYKARCIGANEEVASLLGLGVSTEGRGGGGGGGGGGGSDSPGRRATTLTGSVVVLRCSSSSSNEEEEEEKKGRRRQGGGGGSYALLAGDLADTQRLEKTLEEAGMDWELPTLLIAECVLVYMETEASRALVEVSSGGMGGWVGGRRQGGHIWLKG